MGVIDLDARVKKLEQDAGGGAVIDQLEAAVTALEEQINGDGETDLGLAGDVAALEDEVEALTEYTTTERVVGKWTDGSTVYEKTLLIPGITYSTANVEQEIGTLSGVGQLISMTGVSTNPVAAAERKFYPLPYVYYSTTSSAQRFLSIYLNNTTGKIYMQSTGTWTNIDCAITVRYTKATTP